MGRAFRGPDTRDHRRHAAGHRVRAGVRGDGDRGGDRLAQRRGPGRAPARPRVRRPLGPGVPRWRRCSRGRPRCFGSWSSGCTSWRPWPGSGDVLYASHLVLPAVVARRPRRPRPAGAGPRRGLGGPGHPGRHGPREPPARAGGHPVAGGQARWSSSPLLALAAHRDFAVLPRAVRAVEAGAKPAAALSERAGARPGRPPARPRRALPRGRDRARTVDAPVPSGRASRSDGPASVRALEELHQLVRAPIRSDRELLPQEHAPAGQEVRQLHRLVTGVAPEAAHGLPEDLAVRQADQARAD